MKITKQRLKEIIKEELQSEAIPAEDRLGFDSEPNTFEMSEDELTGMAQVAMRDIDKEITNLASALARLVEQHEGGNFVALQTHVRMLQKKLDYVKEDFSIRLGYHMRQKGRKK